MPAEAGIQAIGENNNFRDLDSCFAGITAFPLIPTQSLGGKGGVRGLAYSLPSYLKEEKKGKNCPVPLKFLLTTFLFDLILHS
jgi:hypothetical protein